MLRDTAIRINAPQSASPLRALTVARLTAAERALRVSIADAAWAAQQASSTGDKALLQEVHLRAKSASSRTDAAALLKLLAKRGSWFKPAQSIDVRLIEPRLLIVNDTLTRDLWSLGRSYWSLPFNKGYGRRLRFVVIDAFHENLIGLIGLQSPPADLACRDQLFSFPNNEKLRYINQTMDAYTVGAIPPYSALIGGKLCAGLLASDTVRQAYWRAYAGSRSIVEGSLADQPLVAITTTSAFGRSSQYNRLKYKERLLAQHIGETKGYGMLHLERLYPEITAVLESRGLLVSGGYGNGPKVRWQNASRAMHLLGLSNSLLLHGLKRPVYLFPLVDALAKGMSGDGFGASLPLPELDYSEFWRERWAVPRAVRVPEWSQIDPQDVLRKSIARGQ